MSLVLAVLLLVIAAFIVYQDMLQRILSAIHRIGPDSAPEDHLTEILHYVRNAARADAVVVLERVDAYTARVVSADPAKALPSGMVNASIFHGALDTMQPVFARGEAIKTPVLRAMSVSSASILPTTASSALVCLWKRPLGRDFLLRGYLKTVASALRLLMRHRDLAQDFRATTMRLNAILATLPQGVIFLDQSGAYAWVNPTAAALLGIEAGVTTPAVTSQAMSRLRSQAKAAADEDGKQAQLFSQQPIRDWEWTYPDRILNVSHIVSENGRVWMFEDVTQRKQLESDQIRYTLERERRRMLTEFIQNAAHEFRTPLAIINTNAYLMTRLEDEELRFSKAEQIQQQVARTTRLIDMMLSMTNLQTLTTLPSTTVDLVALIDEVCRASRAVYGDQPRLYFDKPAAPLYVAGSSNYLTEAIRQMVDNAYRYTAQDGLITVKAGSQDHQVWLSVRDTGQGIASDAIPHIFDTFYRHDEAHATPGFGLGLPITRRIIELHHGKISVDSQIGSGTVFLVVLPAADAEAMPA